MFHPYRIKLASDMSVGTLVFFALTRSNEFRLIWSPTRQNPIGFHEGEDPDHSQRSTQTLRPAISVRWVCKVHRHWAIIAPPSITSAAESFATQSQKTIYLLRRLLFPLFSSSRCLENISSSDMSCAGGFWCDRDMPDKKTLRNLWHSSYATQI